MASPGVTAFISYSQDNEEHKRRVLALADQLTIDGIAVALDQYQSGYPEGLEIWMQRQIDGADFVIMVCTETYLSRAEKREEKGKGLGASWEGHSIYQSLYRSGAINTKHLPVLLPGSGPECIPSPLRGSFPYYEIDTSKMLLGEKTGYEKLYRRLTEQHDTPPPVRGIIHHLPIRGNRREASDAPAVPP